MKAKQDLPPIAAPRMLFEYAIRESSLGVLVQEKSGLLHQRRFLPEGVLG